MVLVLSLAVGGELGQATGIVQGVFDFLDLALIIVAFLAAQTIAFSNDKFTENWRIP